MKTDKKYTASYTSKNKPKNGHTKTLTNDKIGDKVSDNNAKSHNNANNNSNNKITDAVNKHASTVKTIEIAMQLGVIFLILFLSMGIIKPFIIPAIWAVILAVATYPIFSRLKTSMGNRNKLAATVMTLLMLAVLMTPTLLISASIFQSAQRITENVQKDSLLIPPPNRRVNTWPYVGNNVYRLWKQAASDLENSIKIYSSEVNKIGQSIISATASTGATVIQFVLSIIFAGLLLASTCGAHGKVLKISQRLAGDSYGKKFTELAITTIRNVTHGVLGVAIIQALLAAIGFYVMGVPAWGIWTVLILILAMTQLSPILVLGPIVFYMFSVLDTTSAIVFTIWCVVIAGSDAFLKPMFSAREISTPMLVIVLGAIGGMLVSGLIGLFIGPVILALSYELFATWLDNSTPKVASES